MLKLMVRKSAFREIDPEALFPENRNENEYVRALVIGAV
jgi:hypothetical protein